MRTFKQKGIGYGPDTVTITAKINGNVVYDGPVHTENAAPPPPDPAIDLGVDMFTWTIDDVSFQGSAQVEITVNNDANSASYLMLTDTLANYIQIYDSILNHWTWGGPDVFGTYFFETVTDNIGEYIASDPLKSVMIDGIPVLPHPTRDFSGQYHWRLLPQQTLNSELMIQSGILPAPWPR